MADRAWKPGPAWETRRPLGLKPGDRVELIHCCDVYTKLTPGTLGTIRLVDDRGTVHVNWDDGSTLGLISDAGDRFKVISDG